MEERKNFLNRKSLRKGFKLHMPGNAKSVWHPDWHNRHHYSMYLDHKRVSMIPDWVVLNHWNQASRRPDADSRKEEISLLSAALNFFAFMPSIKSGKDGTHKTKLRIYIPEKYFQKERTEITQTDTNTQRRPFYNLQYTNDFFILGGGDLHHYFPLGKRCTKSTYPLIIFAFQRICNKWP